MNEMGESAKSGRETQGETRNDAGRLGLARTHFAAGIGARLTGALTAMLLLWCDGALAAGPKVILLRGWLGVFSTGLDSIADQLKAQGIETKVAGHLYWSNAVADIVRERSAGPIGPLVLVGHSQGANNVIDMARSLESHNITIDVLVTLSPFMQNAVPANVVKAINYYQSAGWGQPLAGDHNFHGKIVNVDLAADPTITHVSIDKSAKVQAEILREIIALARQSNERKK
jgi:pimeloyl-ACP methyl ester carboxylesterase